MAIGMYYTQQQKKNSLKFDNSDLLICMQRKFKYSVIQKLAIKQTKLITWRLDSLPFLLSSLFALLFHAVPIRS